MVAAMDERLRKAAEKAAGNAWSPYSGFPVGAAVRAADGTIYAGCNVENRSFGLTQCAERSAMTAAVAAGCRPGDLVELLIYTPGDVAHPPCGACRQVMVELLAAAARVHSVCDGDEVRSGEVQDYLPEPFLHELARKD
jgi:cytidine deaminase